MARRKNPLGTFFLVLAVAALAGAAYKFLYVERIFDNETVFTPPASEIERLRAACEESLSSDPCFVSISMFNWRDQSKRYRIDINMSDGCGIPDAKRMATRLSELVKRSTDGYEAEVSCLILTREVYHYVP